MREALSLLGLAAALACAGCHKAAPAPDAAPADGNAAAPLLENGTASDITAADATIGVEGNMLLEPPPPTDGAEAPAREKPARPAPADETTATDAGGGGNED